MGKKHQFIVSLPVPGLLHLISNLPAHVVPWDTKDKPPPPPPPPGVGVLGWVDSGPICTRGQAREQQ